MIKYRLTCKNCNVSFDSWFASSNEFEKLKKKNFLNCHHCDSKNVDKSLMAPKLNNKPLIEKTEQKDIRVNEINKKIKEYQKFIKKNFDYVGKNFAYEARSVHYKNKKISKGIYGTVTNEDLKELKEEGIEAELIPWIKDNTN